MADQKVSQLPALTGAGTAAGDLLYIVDISEPLPADQSKKITLTELQSAPVSAGTANGVLYLNGSKVVTSGSALTYNGTGFGIGISSAAGNLDVYTATTSIGYVRTANQTLKLTADDASGRVDIANAAGSPVSFTVGVTEQMRLTSTGLGIGTSSPSRKLDVQGTPVGVGGAGTGVLANFVNNTTAFNASPTAAISLWNRINTAGSTFPSAVVQAGKENATDGNYAGYLSLQTTDAAGVSTERMRLDSSGNLGLGVVPSGWGNAYKALQVSSGASYAGSSNAAFWYCNAYNDNTNWRYVTSTNASGYAQFSGAHAWFAAPSGTAGDPISFTQAMTLDASGNLGVGQTSPGAAYRLHITNNATDAVAQINTGLSTGFALWRAENSSNFVYSAGMAASSGAVTPFTNNAGYVYTNGAGGLSLISGNSTAPMVFWTNNTERMRLDYSGNLGLGVTPSVWTSYKALQISTGASLASTANQMVLGSNWSFDGSDRYVISDFSTLYIQNSGQHKWYTAPSGTAGNPISFTQAMDLANSAGASTLTVNSAINTASAVRLTTNGGLTAGLFLAAPTVDHSLGFQTAGAERMRLDASGNLGIGTSSPGVKLDVNGTGRVTTEVRVKNTAGNVSYLTFEENGNGNSATFISGDARTTGNMGFWTNSTERARITSGGDLLVGTLAQPAGASCRQVVKYDTSDYTSYFWNSNASPYGVRVQHDTDVNGTSNPFLICVANATERASIRSNGGLANYQSNNVDLSDARTKKDIAPAPSYWGKIGALEIVTYKYKDQTHDDVNVGVIAQQVEQVEPVWVDSDGFGEVPEDGIPLKTVYTKDITFAAIKALQEAMTRIEQLEARLAAAGI